jgi:hypothetical protein
VIVAIISIFISVAPLVAVGRILAIAASLGLWFWTQSLLSRRNPVTSNESAAEGGPICDGIHRLTAPINARLHKYPRRADLLLIASSGVIDLLGFFVLGSAILGPSIEPFLGLQLLFALRQICQAFCPLPPPAGMIWRDPGVPTVLVTYGTSCDLFFSGHTAIAVYGALTLAAAFGPVGAAIGLVIVIFEISVVLVLRAHYTMDVFTGAITALYVHRLAMDWAPAVDRFIVHLVRLTGH